MKVQDIIKCLEESYKPDDFLIIDWWDKSIFDAHFINHEGDNAIIPDAVWEITTKRYHMPDHLVSEIHDDIESVLYDERDRNRA